MLVRVAEVVIGVVGGSGGMGASTFAGVLARAAAPAVLVDLDEVGGGIDVLLGIESERGARWSGVRLDGGRLDPALLAEGLPRWHGVAVLAADVAPPDAAAVLEVVDAAAHLGAVVIDLPRAASDLRDAVVARCALCVLVVGADVRAVAAARAVVRSLPDGALGAVVRRGELPVDEAVDVLGVPLLGVLPPVDRQTPVDRLPRVASRVALGLLDGLVDGVVA